MFLGPTEAIFLIGAMLLLFGPDKIPEVAQSLGLAAKRFKEGFTETKSIITDQAADLVKPISDEEKLFDYAKNLGINIKNKNIEDIATEILKHTDTGV